MWKFTGKPLFQGVGNPFAPSAGNGRSYLRPSEMPGVIRIAVRADTGRMIVPGKKIAAGPEDNMAPTTASPGTWQCSAPMPPAPATARGTYRFFGLLLSVAVHLAFCLSSVHEPAGYGSWKREAGTKVSGAVDAHGHKRYNR